MPSRTISPSRIAVTAGSEAASARVSSGTDFSVFPFLDTSRAEPVSTHARVRKPSKFRVENPRRMVERRVQTRQWHGMREGK